MAEADDSGVFHSCLYTRHKTQKHKKWQDGKAKINFAEKSARIFALETGKFVCTVKAGSDFQQDYVETESFLVDLSEAMPLSGGEAREDENQAPSLAPNPLSVGGGGLLRKKRRRGRVRSSLDTQRATSLPCASSASTLPRSTNNATGLAINNAPPNPKVPRHRSSIGSERSVSYTHLTLPTIYSV